MTASEITWKLLFWKSPDSFNTKLEFLIVYHSSIPVDNFEHSLK